MNYGSLHLRLIGVSVPFLKLKKCPEVIDALNVSQELYIQFKVELRKEREVIGSDRKLNASERHSGAYRYVGNTDAFQGKVKPPPLLAVSNS